MALGQDSATRQANFATLATICEKCGLGLCPAWVWVTDGEPIRPNSAVLSFSYSGGTLDIKTPQVEHLFKIQSLATL